jgi:hypothetical protein
VSCKFHIVTYSSCFSQPETLTNQILFKLRRDFLLHGSKLYEALLPNLSPNLQPLAVLDFAGLDQEPSTSDQLSNVPFSDLKLE